MIEILYSSSVVFSFKKISLNKGHISIMDYMYIGLPPNRRLSSQIIYTHTRVSEIFFSPSDGERTETVDPLMLEAK